MNQVVEFLQTAVMFVVLTPIGWMMMAVVAINWATRSGR